MNSNHDNGKTDPSSTDPSLNDDLDQIDQLYHAHGSQEPPEMLDQAILNKARRALEPKNSWLDFGWIHGVTTAALVVLTFSIFTTQRDSGEFEPTLGEPVNQAARKATGDLSGKASESGASFSNQQELQVAADEDAPMTNQPLEPFMEEKLAAPKEVMKEAIKEESREREQVSQLKPMRAPASSPVPAPQADKSRLEIDSATTPTAGAPAVLNEYSVSAKKHNKADQEFRSIDELKDDMESEQAPTTDQLQMIEQILVYKNAGDERWIEELESFKVLYPDFPLPDELEE